MDEIQTRSHRGERVLVTTLTKRMAEELAEYLRLTQKINDTLEHQQDPE